MVKNQNLCEYVVPKGSNPRILQTARLLSILHGMTDYDDEHQQGGWISIHSKVLQSEVGRHYRAVIDELVTMGIVESQGSWQQGHRANGYRLTEKFRDGEHEVSEQSRGVPAKTRIRIDDTDTTALNLVAMFDKVMIPEGVQAEGWNGSALARIRRGQFFATRGSYGRLFTSFSNLSKAIRKELHTVDGERLVEVDVASCQPLLLWRLALNRSGHSRTETFSPQYRTLCESGQLYDYLLELCQTESHKQSVPDRLDEVNWPRDKGELKEAFLSMLFTRVGPMRRSPVYKLFKKAFPDMARYLVASKKKNYRQTSWDCQLLESQLIVDGACTSVLASYPEAVLLTVHDAVLVQKKFVGVVESAILNEFRSIGVSPTLKIDGVSSPSMRSGMRDGGREARPPLHTLYPMSCTSNV